MYFLYFIVLYSEEYVYISSDSNEFMDEFFMIYTTDYLFFIAAFFYYLFIGYNLIITYNSDWYYFVYIIRGFWVLAMLEYFTIVYYTDYAAKPVVVETNSFFINNLHNSSVNQNSSSLSSESIKSSKHTE